MPIPIDDIIDRLGGPELAARLTGVTTEAVRKWRQAGAIPSRHWAAVSAATGLPMDELSSDPPALSGDTPPGATAALVLADGTVFWGRGFGAHTQMPAPVGEICFNTGMTGYQEKLTDPSYAGQIITFTFPHIGNVGTNLEDIEASSVAARGLVVKLDITEPANWRATQHLDGWREQAAAWPGLEGMDLAKEVTCRQMYEWDETRWAWPEGYGRQTAPKHH